MLDGRPPVGDEEPTVRFAGRDFRRRRFVGRLRRLRGISLGLLVLALVGVGVWLLYSSPFVRAEQVGVEGAGDIGAQRVERAARVPLGGPLVRVDLDAVAARVESLAAVRSAEVSRGWPDTVRIEVTPRTPLAVVDQGSGLRSMDAEGVVFGAHPTRPADLPLVRTPEGTGPEALVEAGRVIDALPGAIAAKVELLEVASVDRIELVLGSGRRVVWGSAESSARKAEVLAVLLRQEGQVIDVSAPGRPTTR